MYARTPRLATRNRWLSTATLLLATAAAAQTTFAAPQLQSVSGALNHGATVTITGSGFGAKTTAAPLAWDDATGNAVTDIWNGVWPNALPGYNLGYYTPMRGIPLPHSHVTRYIAGAHAADTGANSGYDVLMWKHVTVPALPFYIYASWYQRADSQWHFGGDNNFKTFDWSNGDAPYANAPNGPQNWYVCYGPPHPNSVTDEGAQWTTAAGTPLEDPDQNGHIAWWGNAVNPMAEWSKVEIAIKVSDQHDGYVNIWENGKQVMNYVGITDNYGGTHRAVAVGGYARMQGYPGNWRYFDDVYVDTTLSRVVLADKPVLSQATIVENQIPSAWNDGSITARVNLGKFAAGEAAYLFVVDASGNPSAAGLAVTVGGTSVTPNPPSDVSVH
jgi:hypothetical protein